MTDKKTPGRSLFSADRQRRSHGICAIVTGQVGLDKRPFLDRVVELARADGQDVRLFNVGELMYAEAPDIVAGRILDLSRQRLVTLRRSVFKDIVRESRNGANIIVNTHATFRWKHGLFHAYDHTQIAELDPDLYITLVDNVDAVHGRLERDHDIKHTLKDILVWREEEIVVTEAMAEAVAGFGHSYVLSRSNPTVNALAMYRLMFDPARKRVYPSFPMTHVLELPDVMAEIDRFRDTLAELFITFDPADVDEKRLLSVAADAAARGEEEVVIQQPKGEITLNVAELMRVSRDIDAQIYARDFKLIDQADMIVSYIPALADGRPALSSGVERELQHAYEGTKEVFVIWRPKTPPSPFITETATAVFGSLGELLKHCQDKGYIGDYQLPFDTAESDTLR